MPDIAVAHRDDPFVTAYPWTPGSGFGVKYANPATKPTSWGQGVAFCGITDVAVAHYADPYVSAYPWAPGSGFGAKYANPASKPTGTCFGVAFCGITDIAAAEYTTPPYIAAYPWTPGSGFGGKYSQPATLPTGPVSGVAFCGSTDIAATHNSDPYVSAYPWTPGSGFGVKYADPATKPAGTAKGVAFCGSTDIAVADNPAPYVSAYPWTPGSGFGAKYADPATKPTGWGNEVAFCGATDVAVAHENDPYVSAYPWTPGSGFGAKYANPATKPAWYGRGVAFCGATDIAVATFNTPYVSAYPWTPGSGFGVKYSDPGTTPGSRGNDVAFAIEYVPPGGPTVWTFLCTDIDHNSGTGNGWVTDLGDSAVTQHGHCWSESHYPTIADFKTENGAKAATGPFSSAITGLDPETLYYVRAYATNTQGTVYGAEVELTTFAAGAPTVTTQECTSIQSETATGNGTLVDIGDSAVTEHGHVWATDPNPTTDDFKTTKGARGVGVFDSSLVGLTPGETYYVRAYATNTQGTAYGDNVVLECPTADIPVVTTQACSAVNPESATGHGNIVSFGDDTPSEHGHCWSTSQYPTLADPHTELWIPLAPGAFTSPITGLAPDTRYYVRAYATNVYGTAYGNQVSFFTYPGGVVINPWNPVGVDWADDGNYIDIHEDIMETYIEWGKDRELGEATPSLLSLTVDNFDHKYSPPNASSPYNQGGKTVRPGHRIRFPFAYPFDYFTDVDGVAIEDHVVPRDSQFAWSQKSGTFSIFQDQLRETGGSGGIAVLEFGEPDAHIQVDFTKGANNDGIIVFRYSNATNYLYVRTDGTDLEVRKVVGGADTLVDSESLAWANAATKTIKVILHGQYIYVVVGDTLLIKTEHTHNQTETKHGVGGPSIGTAARYDNFGGIYSMFYGTIDRIIPYPNKERQTCLIEASDDLKILERHILYRRAYSYTAYPGGTRSFIQEVYKNTANVSQLGEIMDLGEEIVSSPFKSWWGISGLRVCRNVEREENGFFYQDQASFWRFEAKAHRTSAPHTTSRCIFYQDYETNNLAFTGLKWASGEEDVFNMVSVHVEKSKRHPLNLPTGGQEVWRCAEADVLDGGVTSQLAIPAESSVVIYFESKDFDCLVDLITPATASNVYRIEGKITDGPFLLGETVTGSVSTHTGKVLEQGGGYIILGDCSGAFNVADIWIGATSAATIAIGYKIEGTIADGPFLWGEGITTDVSTDTGVVREVGQDFLVLESCSGAFAAGDTLTGATSTATLNGTITITAVGSKTAIPDYQANAAADGSGADKTGNLTVALSYPVYNSYGKGGKLTLTNDDTSPIYVTRLLVRGDGYNLQSRGSVYVEDVTSKETFGEHSYDVKAEILTSLAQAKVLADDVESKEDTPRAKVEITLTNANKEMLTKILSLKISDRITVNYSDMGIDEDFFINKIIYTILEGGLVVEAVLKLEEVS